MSLELRAYQIEALERLRESFRAGHKRVMLYSPTGSGKTEVSIEMIRGALARKRRCLFVVNRIGLVEQASQRLLASDIDNGVVQGANTRGLGLPVLCCSIQTLARRGIPDDAGLIVIDEAHGTAAAKAYHDLLAATKGVPVVGLSATPFARGLAKVHEAIGGPLWEDLVVAATIRELIEGGFLVDCEIFAPSKPDLSEVRVVAGDYVEDQLGAAMDKPTLIADIVETWSKLGCNKKTVVFATNIAHSKHIVEKFNSWGVRAEHIDCYTSDKERHEIMRRLNEDEIKVISNVAVLAEGWDCPSVEVMVLARPTRSLSRYIQMAGRVLRPSPGKALARLLDHSDTCERLGFPTDDLPLELDDGKARKAGDSEKPVKLPKLCPSCKFLKPAGVHKCPACGFAPQKRDDVEVRAGELAQIKRSKVGVMQKQQVFSELLSIALQRGFSDGWAAHKYREIFGTWPRGLHSLPAAPSFAVSDWVKRSYHAWKAGKPAPKPEFV